MEKALWGGEVRGCPATTAAATARARGGKCKKNKKNERSFGNCGGTGSSEGSSPSLARPPPTVQAVL